MEEAKKALETEFDHICGVAKQEVSHLIKNWILCFHMAYLS